LHERSGNDNGGIDGAVEQYVNLSRELGSALGGDGEMGQDHAAAAEWAEIRSQRHLQVFDAIDQDLARRIGAVIADIGTKENLSVTIAVHLGEQLVFQSALDGTTAAHDGWVRRKRRTTLLYDAPSLEVALSLQISGRRPDWLDSTKFAVAGGAVPLRVGGAIVGVIAVSGLTSSARADHDLVMRGLTEVRRELLATTGSTPLPPVA
jgi:uncharacterized protein (UPF0303 family)